MNLVIVDDIATNRKLLRVTLEAEGHTTFEAGDGLEALQILGHEKVDAVLSDILMPRMDGYRLCHEIRRDDRLRHLPIVIYTSTYTSSSDEKLARDLGADKYLRKPASVATILTTLHQAIATAHTEPRPESMQEVEVLKEYSNRLVMKLEERNIELEERLKLCALSMDVGAALTHGKTLKEILERCTQAFVTHLDAALARIWTHNEGEKVLELQASAGAYTEMDGPPSRVGVGQSIIGVIADKRRPHLTNSFGDDPRVPEQEWARSEGLIALTGYPLILGGQVLGVLAMFARQPLSRTAWESIASVADAIALAIERKQAEEELRLRTRELAAAHQRLTILDRSKSDFLNLISHEFRTPLNGLVGVGELILDGMDPSAENRKLQEVFGQSRRRILSILDDALLLTQIDVGGERFRSAPVSLKRALDRAVASAAEFSASRHVRLAAPPLDLGLVAGDENLLARAFHALLETAVKFSEEHRTVHVTHEIVKDSVRVIIESHGGTIPAPAMPGFFDLFSIGEATTSGGDLGLGPAAAYRILALFGASVSVANRKPSGIRLTVSLKHAP